MQHLQNKNAKNVKTHNLQVWVEGRSNTTWGTLLKAMEAAGIGVQQQDRLKEELYSNTGSKSAIGGIYFVFIDMSYIHMHK